MLTVQKMDDFTPKMHADDTKRVEMACSHVSDHVDFEMLAKLLETDSLAQQ
jgi:BioD-like phosphotransacetylase family protein